MTSISKDNSPEPKEPKKVDSPPRLTERPGPINTERTEDSNEEMADAGTSPMERSLDADAMGLTPVHAKQYAF